MPLDSASLPDHVLAKMSLADRQSLGLALVTITRTIKKRGGDELREQKIYQAWLDLHRLPYSHAATHKRPTIAIGFPDFAVFHGEHFLLIEFKSTTGKLSDDQTEYIERCKAYRVSVHLCRSAYEAINLTRNTFQMNT